MGEGQSIKRAYMQSPNTTDNPENVPERPLECGECKKAVRVIYTDISGKTMSRFCMCSDCPVLKRKLLGSSQSLYSTQANEGNHSFDPKASVCCGGCGMSRDEVSMGSRVGCPLCYEIFEEEVLDQLISLNKLPIRSPFIKKHNFTSLSYALSASNGPGPLHTGRRPYSAQEEGDYSLKLVELQKALHETLSREDYEQAAWLRDRIKEITEHSEHQEESSLKNKSGDARENA